jgi:hypothetical protein
MEYTEARKNFNRELFSIGKKLERTQQRLYLLSNRELKDFFCTAFAYYNNLKGSMSLAEKKEGLGIISGYILLFGDDFLKRYDIPNITTEYNNFFKLVNKINAKVIDELNERQLDFLFLEMDNYFNTFFRGPYVTTEQDIASQNQVELFPRLFFLASSKHLLEQFVELDKLFFSFDIDYNLRTIETDQQIIDFYRCSLDYYEQYKNLICSEDKKLILQRIGQISSYFRDQEHIGDGVKRFVDNYDFSFAGVEKINFFRLLNFIQIPVLKGELSEEEVSASLEDISNFLMAYNSQQVGSAEQIKTFPQLYSIVMHHKEKHSLTKAIEVIEKGLKTLKNTEVTKTVKITTFLAMLCYIGEAFTTNNMSSSSREFIQNTNANSFQKLKEIKKFVDKLVKPDKHPFSITQLADNVFLDEENFRILDIYLHSPFTSQLTPYFDLTVGIMEAIKEVFLGLKSKLTEISSTVNDLVEYYYTRQKSMPQDVTGDSAFVHCIGLISENDQETLHSKYKSPKLKAEKKALEQKLKQNYQSLYEKKLNEFKKNLEHIQDESEILRVEIDEYEEQIKEKKGILSAIYTKLKIANADIRLHKKNGGKIPTKFLYAKQDLIVEKNAILKEIKALNFLLKEKKEEKGDKEEKIKKFDKDIENQEGKLKELLVKLKTNQEKLKDVHTEYQKITTEIYNFYQARLNMGKFIFKQIKSLLAEELWQKIFKSEHFSNDVDIAFIKPNDGNNLVTRVPYSYAKQKIGDIPFSTLPSSISEDLYRNILQNESLREYNQIWDELENKVAAEELSIEYYLLSLYQLFEDVVKDTTMHLQFRGLRHFYRHDLYNFYALNKRYGADDKQHKIDMTIHYLIEWVRAINNHSLLNFLLNDNAQELKDALDIAVKIGNKFCVCKLLEEWAIKEELTCSDQKIKFMLFVAQQVYHYREKISKDEYRELIKFLFCLNLEDNNEYYDTKEIVVDKTEFTALPDTFMYIALDKFSEVKAALAQINPRQENVSEIAKIITACIIFASKFKDGTSQERIEQIITVMIKKFPDAEVIAGQEEKVELNELYDATIQEIATSPEIPDTEKEATIIESDTSLTGISTEFYEY